nr:cytochrome b6/f complex subunit V [Boldiaceae sp.]
MVEPLLSGIILGLVFVTLAGLLVAAYLQFRRGLYQSFEIVLLNLEDNL